MRKQDQGTSRGASILIVDDVSEWRIRVRDILETDPRFHVAGEACDGLDAVQKAAELNPDLVLLDIGMPVMNGLEAANRIQQTSPDSKIVFLTLESNADIRSAALAAGADGYVLKANSARELLPTIAAILRDGRLAH